MILKEYLNYTSQSESPESYHIWVFLSMVAAIIGKKTWIKFNYFNTYPNMYVILVSLPGVGKKKRKILLKSLENITSLKEINLDLLRKIKGIDEKTAKNIIEHWQKY